MKKALLAFQLVTSMGLRYAAFRAAYEIRRRSGLLKRRFPVSPPVRQWVSLDQWRKEARPFFFTSREAFFADGKPSDLLNENAARIMHGGELQFFFGEWKKIDWDAWMTNPLTGYTYPKRVWTDIPDFHPAFGDIKYVWEKSRFAFLQTILRYDLHNNTDSAEWVFSCIEKWIQANPINIGPNYRCSQEISLRVFNWIYALYFYRDSPALSDERFSKIVHAIYWQLHHVYENINFSRIAVRNNHAITETLALYVGGMLFPFFEESEKWKRSGKKWLEEEVAYQIYEDGCYLQFSNNYHRVVIQLITFAIAIAHANDDRFTNTFYSRAYASLKFLMTCQDKVSGQLPNYGANDGSLFFCWNDHPFRDFRPALDALHFLLTGCNSYGAAFEDRMWFGLKKPLSPFPPLKIEDGTHSFPIGGIYLYRKDDLMLWINCVRYRDRPSQADSLHLDLWWKGRNILWDAGSYCYNTKPTLIKYFFGTESHNTVMLGENDQMLKGGRFIWYYWSRGLSAGWSSNEIVTFDGHVKVFGQLGTIHHSRKIKIEGLSSISVIDKVQGKGNLTLRQLWHINPEQRNMLRLFARDHEKPLTGELSERFFSSTYGVCENSLQIEFATKEDSVITQIELL